MRKGSKIFITAMSGIAIYAAAFFGGYYFGGRSVTQRKEIESIYTEADINEDGLSDVVIKYKGEANPSIFIRQPHGTHKTLDRVMGENSEKIKSKAEALTHRVPRED